METFLKVSEVSENFLRLVKILWLYYGIRSLEYFINVRLISLNLNLCRENSFLDSQVMKDK